MRGGSVNFRAITDTHVGLPRYTAALPGAVIEVEVPDALAGSARELLSPHLRPDDSIVGWSDGTVIVIVRANQSQVLDLLPRLASLQVEVKLDGEPIESIEPMALLNVAANDRASLTWRLRGWPALPELDLPAQRKHAHVQLTLNSHGIDDLRPAPDHTVYVHTGGTVEEEQRAAWLAHSVGQSVIDSPEWGW